MCDCYRISFQISYNPLIHLDLSALFSSHSAYIFLIFIQLIMPFMPSVRGLYPFKFAYNMIQVMLCSYMCIEAGVRAYSAGYSLLPCNKFNSSEPPIAFILYVFYISKILDFLDTFFIIAEKRFKQLSFLHVYHHTSIFLVSDGNCFC